VAKPVDSCLGGGIGGSLRGYVESHRKQVLLLPDRRFHSGGVASGGNDRVARSESRLSDIDAHTATGSGDEPDILLDHDYVSSCGGGRL
jgi:hypothetical protein